MHPEVYSKNTFLSSSSFSYIIQGNIQHITESISTKAARNKMHLLTLFKFRLLNYCRYHVFKF